MTPTVDADAEDEEHVRLEAEAAANDPADLAEAASVRAEMDAIAAAWTEHVDRPAASRPSA